MSDGGMMDSSAEAEKSTAVFNVEESYPGGAPPAQFNPETGRFETNLPPTESFYTAEQMPGGTKPSLNITPEEGKTGGGGGLGKPPETPTLQMQKEKSREDIKQKRKRRRSLISEEEEGELGAGPVYRRSILGG